jgi:hypothetical protein
MEGKTALFYLTGLVIIPVERQIKPALGGQIEGVGKCSTFEKSYFDSCVEAPT